MKFTQSGKFFIKIKAGSANASRLQYKLYSMDGKLQISKKSEGEKTELKIENLAPAVYTLEISQGNKKLKVMQVIKN